MQIYGDLLALQISLHPIICSMAGLLESKQVGEALRARSYS